MNAFCHSTQFYWHTVLFIRNEKHNLTALEKKCPLHSFSFHLCRMTKSIRPKTDNPSIKMVYHCTLQAHSIFGQMPSCLVAAPTSFICCKPRLDTSILSFRCLHSMYITKAVFSLALVYSSTTELKSVWTSNFCKPLIHTYK